MTSLTTSAIRSAAKAVAAPDARQPSRSRHCGPPELGQLEQQLLARVEVASHAEGCSPTLAVTAVRVTSRTPCSDREFAGRVHRAAFLQLLVLRRSCTLLRLGPPTQDNADRFDLSRENASYGRYNAM